MKKLLVLSLVLQLLTITNAALINLGVDGYANPGEITLAPSDTIELSAVALAGFDMGDFQISLSNAQGSLDASNVEFLSMLPPDWVHPWGIPWHGNLDDPQHFSFSGGNLPPAVIPFDETVMWGLIFHCEEPTDVIITLEEYLDNDQFELLDQIIVHQIPEPITIGLLGMGALFLRQRKK